MLDINNQYTLFKRQIDTEVLKSFFNGTLEEDVDMLEEAEFLRTDTDYIDAVLLVNEVRDSEKGALFDYE